MNYHTVNLNAKVRFRLTDEGGDHYKRNRESYGIESSGLHVDPDGWSELQLYELMNIFGSQTFHGNPQKMFVDNDIQVPHE